MINCIITDDDALCRAQLEVFCKKALFFNVVGLFENGLSCLSFLKDHNVDLLFLDIEMPELNGIDLLCQIPDPPKIIFSTSKPEYAFDAFEFDAIDFLKKPFNYARFLKAANKAKEVLNEPNNSSINKNDIFIKQKGIYIKIDTHEILYIESISDYLCIKTTSGSQTIIGAFSMIQDKLPKDKFIKVHRSFVINIDKIINIMEGSVLIQDKIIPISRNNRQQLFAHLNLVAGK